MADQDLLAMVTSIDENDIEIIPSNGSDINGLLDFVPDHFTPGNSNPTPSVSIDPPPILVQQQPPPNPTVRFNRHDDSEDIEDETLVERLYGLTEMFPNWFHQLFSNTFHSSTYFGKLMRNAIWFCSSSFVVLVLPILVEIEFSQMAQFHAAQTREMLLGPAAQIGTSHMPTAGGLGMFGSGGMIGQ